MNENGYLTLAGGGEAELDEKRSRFLSFAARVTSDAEASEFVASVRSRFPDARHAVYAYVASSSGTLAQRYSDDGEPQGTGGLPVLDVIRKRGLTDAAVVVVRYFGAYFSARRGLCGRIRGRRPLRWRRRGSFAWSRLPSSNAPFRILSGTKRRAPPRSSDFVRASPYTRRTCGVRSAFRRMNLKKRRAYFATPAPER